MVRAWARDCWPAWGVGGMLAVVVFFFAGPWIAQQTFPMSRYYELRSVLVADAVEGTSPHMVVDRVIHQDFRGRFEVETWRITGSEFSPWSGCGPYVSGWRTYRRFATLPDPLTLDWWTDIPPNRPCVLPPGRYRIITTVYAQGPLGAELKAASDSNVFSVHPAE